MRSILLILIILSFAGCASLHKEVFNNIHEGDSSDHVVEILGQPDSYGTSIKEANADAWYYTRRSEICGFTIKEGKVLHLGCGPRANYLSPVGAFFQGFSNGYNANRSVSCTSNTFGTTTQTHCN